MRGAIAVTRDRGVLHGHTRGALIRMPLRQPEPIVQFLIKGAV